MTNAKRTKRCNDMNIVQVRLPETDPSSSSSWTDICEFAAT